MDDNERMNSITIFRSQYETVKNLSDKDFKAIVLAIFDYAFNGIEPEKLNEMQLAVFNMTKYNIDKSNERRRLKAERNRRYYESKKEENLRRIKTPLRHSKTPLRHVKTVSSHNENENENVNVNENVNENEKEKEKENENENVNNNNIYNKEGYGGKVKKRNFSPPTLQDIREYCIERNNTVDPETFFDFYESKGWMVGKNKMKDWKAAVRTWEKNDNNHRGGKGSSYLDAISNRVNIVDSWVSKEEGTDD